MATQRDLHAFNETWSRVQRIAGNANPTTWPFDLFFGSGVSGATFEPLTIFVDSVSGLDVNPGTVEAPLKTVQNALSRLPKKIRHPITISLAAGNYDGFAINDFDIDYADPTLGAFLMITGTLANSTVATGTATGTVTSAVQGVNSTNTYAVVNDTAQTWTVDDLKGKFFVITGGTGVGQIYPITANTATSPLPYLTGLRFEYTVTASYAGGLLKKYVINRVT